MIGSDRSEVFLRFFKAEKKHKIKPIAIKLTSESVSVNFATKIRNVPNSAKNKKNVARPSVCLKNRFSLEKNISPVATAQMYRIASEIGIPIKGDFVNIELNIITVEKTTKRMIIVQGHLSMLVVLSWM